MKKEKSKKTPRLRRKPPESAAATENALPLVSDYRGVETWVNNGIKVKRAEAVEAPSVFWDRGYLLLALSERAGKVSFLRCSTGQRELLPTSEFLRIHEPCAIRAPWLALSLLGRAVEHSFDTSMGIFRQLLQIADEREVLAKMPPQSFGPAYERIVLNRSLGSYLGYPPTESRLDAVLQRIHEEREALSPGFLREVPEDGDEDHFNEGQGQEEEFEQMEDPKDTSSNPQAGSEQPPSEQQQAASTDKGDDDMTTAAASTDKGSKKKGLGLGKSSKSKEGGGKGKVAGAAAKKKKEGEENAKKVIAPTSKKNPYREGSMKAKCFDLFAKGGERGKILEGMKKLGAKNSTASSWFGAFTKVKG